jgi:FolB domain-containing protein
MNSNIRNGGNAVAITIKNLRLRTVIGVDEAERRGRQEVIANITFTVAGGQAAESDDLADTVDYAALSDRIAQEVEGSQFRLLEALAGRICRIVLADPKVGQVTVEVDKPGALKSADSVSATCRAERKR